MLPSLAENPNANVVIFDGHCNFCRAQVERLAKWDKGKILSFISLHDDVVAERWSDLTHDQLMKEMYLIDRNGNRYAGAYALRWMTLRLPRLWPLAPLMHIPLSMLLWSFLYRQVARVRYRWGKSNNCENGSCDIHYGKS